VLISVIPLNFAIVTVQTGQESIWNKKYDGQKNSYNFSHFSSFSPLIMIVQNGTKIIQILTIVAINRHG